MQHNNPYQIAKMMDQSIHDFKNLLIEYEPLEKNQLYDHDNKEFVDSLCTILLRIDSSWNLGLKILQKQQGDSFERFSNFVSKVFETYKNTLLKNRKKMKIDKLLMAKLLGF